ncbi:MAG TPA: 16S rRNA (guanine(966)-N(2))-methyltransferase RsmD [Dongiaceae bacterium]|jgi:16S rRNA (guanine966-N2)-methyltransferase|nr:16S rRNA (guanine(966)-N(2))-methyltransferase RsmD [Dongiaceae bacterium]
MRIDAGSHRGVKLAAPEGEDTRPTSDRARQAVFNILAHTHDAIRAAKVLDVFAGSGALGLEALSRGAERASFIESDRKAGDCIKRNIAACREQARAQLFIADALRPPRAPSGWAPCSLIFLDPPYGKGLIPPTLIALKANGWIAPDALIVAEVDRWEALEPGAELAVLDDRHYGKARILLLRHA